jgi:formate dehydrogenase major subunit
VLEVHPFDAENRGLSTGDLVLLASRAGETTLRAVVTERVQPGVVYTTFHHAKTNANVVTTEHSECATKCPEYKVTAVQVSKAVAPAAFQVEDRRRDVALRQVERPGGRDARR